MSTKKGDGEDTMRNQNPQVFNSSSLGTIPGIRPVAEEERPRSQSHARVGWFTLMGGLLVAVGSWALFQGAIERDPRWWSISLGCIVAMLFLLDRKSQHDKLSSTIRKFADQEAPPEPEPIVETWVTTKDGGSVGLIEIGRYKLRPDSWNNLGQAIIQNKNHFVRDIVPAGTFTNLTSRWNDIIAEFRRLGVVDDKSDLTEFGISFFTQFCPYPTIEKAYRQFDGQTTTTTTGDEASS